jgi:hypothetical protein
MKQFILFILFPASLFMNISAAAQDEWKGRYSLRMERQSRWNSDYIIIKSIDEKTLAGEAGIDLTIGPQARTPMPHEKFYKLPFRAKILKEGGGFTFVVRAAKDMVYDFTLFFLRSGESLNLVGYVKVSGGKKLKGIVPLTTGVLAVKEK